MYRVCVVATLLYLYMYPLPGVHECIPPVLVYKVRVLVRVLVLNCVLDQS